MEGLQRLEYRGYDSAGDRRRVNNRLSVQKAKGKVATSSDSCPRN